MNIRRGDALEVDIAASFKAHRVEQSGRSRPTVWNSLPSALSDSSHVDSSDV